jgi:sugar phosphate isomerase/epimerase
MTDALGLPAGHVSRLSLNQATLETRGTHQLVDACQAAGIGMAAPWRHKYVDGDARLTRRVLDQAGIAVSGLCRGGFFTGTRPEAEARRDNRMAVEEAAVLGSPVLVLVCGPVTDTGAAAARAAIARGIEDLLPYAAEHGIVLAVEPFHPMFAAERSAIVRLDQATELVARFDHPNLGIAVDTYHVWWDPDLPEALTRAAPRVVSVHVADWLVPTTSLLAGRGLPGDGVIDLVGLLGMLASAGYAGALEVEVLNPDVWSRDPAELGRDIARRMSSILEAARSAA